ncbi:TatD family hydrolase [Alphaproteobacteria bacterium]|nr:TatD family hydrolase [Alphaproteobacteria bacterium]
MLIDSHCHLNDPKLKEDLPQILERAKALEIERLLTISTELKEVPDLEALSDTYSQIYHTVGVHPHEVGSEGIPSTDALKKYLQHPKAIGIGETGLDYYYEHSDRLQQKESFRNHIHAMKETGLPLIIHSRDAEDDILQILKEENVKKCKNPGVIHCFSGTEKFAQETLDLGFYISLSGILTFKNAESIRETAKFVPLDRLLVETDAPYLAPIPHRGKRNEPSFVVHTAEKLAEIRNLTTQEVARVTTENFFTLFSKAESL